MSESVHFISKMISDHLKENPQDAAILCCALASGMTRAINKSNDHASKCQHAVSAMAALASPGRLSKEAGNLLSDFLVKQLPYLDDTPATKKLAAKLGGGK